MDFGVKDPDAEWGQYALLRPWDKDAFRASLSTAQRTPRTALKPDGNRAIMYCTTTDPYQVFRHADPSRSRGLTTAALEMVRRSLEIIRDESDLRVRIMTRSPLARTHFELFKSFGSRLVFGMSLPTLRNDLAAVYEPQAPAPSQRLATLQAARSAGLHVYVAMAPTYPECDEGDLDSTLRAIAGLNPITVFHEPINIRADNVERIAAQAARLKVGLRTEVFATRESWKDYSIQALKSVTRLAKIHGLGARLHLWPDKGLGSRWVVESMPDPHRYETWLRRTWSRISEWPASVSAAVV